MMCRCMFSDLVAGGINRVFHPGQSQPATGSSTLTPAISPSFAQASIVRRTKLEIEASCENGDTLTKSIDLPAPVPPTPATLPRRHASPTALGWQVAPAMRTSRFSKRRAVLTLTLSLIQLGPQNPEADLLHRDQADMERFIAAN